MERASWLENAFLLNVARTFNERFLVGVDRDEGARYDDASGSEHRTNIRL